MDTLFFLLSKLLWALFQPDSVLLLVLLATLILLWRKREAAAVKLLSITVAVLMLLTLFPIGQWLLYPLETRFTTNPILPQQIDGIIVLGGAINPIESYSWNQPEQNQSAERNIAFAALARQHPEATLLMSGGSGRAGWQQYKEADIAPILFKDLGLDTSNIILERDSRNTWENALYSKALVKSELESTWVLITSAYHMPRSVGIFCKQQWTTIPWPVDHLVSPAELFIPSINLAGHLSTLKIAIHEWLGLLSYRLSGKTTQLLPSTCQE